MLRLYLYFVSHKWLTIKSTDEKFVWFLGNTNTSLRPLSLGAKQKVANSLTDFQEEPSKGELKLPCELYYIMPYMFYSLNALLHHYISSLHTSILHLTNGGYASAGAAEDLLNTNTFLSPLSLGVKEVANFVHDHQEEPPKGELKLWHDFY